MTDRTKTLPAPTGVPGIKHSNGYLMDEWDRSLQGKRGPETYRIMAESDPTVGAVLYGIESLVRGAGHRIEPANETSEAETAATFVEECLADMTGAWGDTLADVLTCIPFGFSLFELVYKFRNGPTLDAKTSAFNDGKIGWQRWAIRAQETIQRWEFAPDQTPTAAEQYAPPNYKTVLIPLDKCLLFRVRGRKNSPEGLSMLRNIYEPWYYRKNIMRIEAIGIERDLAGLPMAMIPSNVIVAAGAEYNSYVEIVTNVRRDEQAGFVWPSDRDDNGNLVYEFKLLSTGGTRQIETDAVIARYERYILRALMADFMTLGDQGVGSHAQASSRIDLFVTGLKAIMDSIADVIDTQAIRPLFALNGMNLELAPSFKFNEIEKEDVAGFVGQLVQLINAGVVNGSDPDLVQHVYDMLGLPAPKVTAEQAQQDATGAQTPPEEDAQNPQDPNAPEKPAQDAKQASEQELEGALAFLERWAPAGVAS